MWLFGKKKKKSEAAEVTKKSASQTITELLGYPCEIFPARTPAETIRSSYYKALEQGKTEGFVPVLISSDDILAEHLEIMMRDGYSVKETLEKDLSHGKEYLDGALERMGDYDEEFSIEEMIGEVEQGEVINEISGFCDSPSHKTLETALIRIPTENPWEIPAYVPFGDWNDCPSAVNMTAVCKYWYDKYKAIPAVITHDILEFVLPEPVNGDEAMDIALEHFAFCEDRVFQGTATGMIGELADCLRKSRVWFFWWD